MNGGRPSWQSRLASLTGAPSDGQTLRHGIAALTHELELHDPADAPALVRLMQRLYAAGRHDLALGRLYEGHVDALQIIGRYARPDIAARVHAQARAGASFGVWNAPLPGEPLRVADRRLTGGKAFASGAGLLTHALVTVNAGEPDRVQLLLLELARHAPAIDTSWWQTLGMQASRTHLVRWSDEPLAAEDFIGDAGDYEREPWFSGGALRFVTVQAGGIAALFDQTRDHLVAAGRAGDPQQRARLATLYQLADQAAGSCRRTAEAWFDGTQVQRSARVSNARCAVAELAERAIVLAQQSVGVMALFDAHPLSRTIADLMVYLRQPGPDAQRARVGEAAAAGELVPTL